MKLLERRNTQIVTNATNIKVGDYVPVARIGAVLPGDFKIKKGKLRGVLSEGMFCGAEELTIPSAYVEESKDGIYIRPSRFIWIRNGC